MTTTRPTDEEIRAMIQTLDLRNGTFKERAMLKAWLAERQAARDVVTDEMVELALKAHREHLSTSWDVDMPSAQFMAMREALEAIAQPVSVPHKIPIPNKGPFSRHKQGYARGWNACREAMLSTSPQPQQAVPDGYIELNMSNYNEDDVSQLNDWAIRAHAMLSAAPAYNGKKDG